MSEHTPTPWVHYQGSDHIREDASDAVIATLDNGGHCDESIEIFDPPTVTANAAFIVIAVNCHDDLLAALAGLAKVVKDTHEPAAYEVHLKHAAHVIAKAKAKA